MESLIIRFCISKGRTLAKTTPITITNRSIWSFVFPVKAQYSNDFFVTCFGLDSFFFTTSPLLNSASQKRLQGLHFSFDSHNVYTQTTHCLELISIKIDIPVFLFFLESWKNMAAVMMRWPLQSKLKSVKINIYNRIFALLITQIFQTLYNFNARCYIYVFLLGNPDCFEPEFMTRQDIFFKRITNHYYPIWFYR